MEEEGINVENGMEVREKRQEMKWRKEKMEKDEVEEGVQKADDEMEGRGDEEDEMEEDEMEEGGTRAGD